MFPVLLTPRTTCLLACFGSLPLLSDRPFWLLGCVDFYDAFCRAELVCQFKQSMIFSCSWLHKVWIGWTTPVRTRGSYPPKTLYRYLHPQTTVHSDKRSFFKLWSRIVVPLTILTLRRLHIQATHCYLPSNTTLFTKNLFQTNHNVWSEWYVLHLILEYIWQRGQHATLSQLIGLILQSGINNWKVKTWLSHHIFVHSAVSTISKLHFQSM